MPFYPGVPQNATLSGIALNGGVGSRLERPDVTSSSAPIVMNLTPGRLYSLSVAPQRV